MDFHADQAIYLQIADYICERIISEKWVEDEKIPSIRDLAVEIEVNPNTVMRTYTHLQDRGVIFNRRGKGFFVAEGAVAKTRDLMKNAFIANDLPRIFRMLAVLEMSIADIDVLYRQYQAEK